MSLASDIADDFDQFDDVETVTYQSRTLAGVITSYTGVKALKRATTGDLIGFAQGAQSMKDAARWHVKASTLSVAPKRGDRIVSTTGTWEVLSDNVETLATRYVLETVKVS